MSRLQTWFAGSNWCLEQDGAGWFGCLLNHCLPNLPLQPCVFYFGICYLFWISCLSLLGFAYPFQRQQLLAKQLHESWLWSHLDLSLAAHACFILIALLIIKINSVSGPLSAFLNVFPKITIPNPRVCMHICNVLPLLLWGVLCWGTKPLEVLWGFFPLPQRSWGQAFLWVQRFASECFCSTMLLFSRAWWLCSVPLPHLRGIPRSRCGPALLLLRTELLRMERGFQMSLLWFSYFFLTLSCSTF